MRTVLIFALGSLSITGSVDSSRCRAQDWPQWGGSLEREYFPRPKGCRQNSIPRRVPIRKQAACGGRSNFRLAYLYGNPVVSGGKVFVGTNNAAPRDPKYAGDRNVLMCFNDPTANSSGSWLCQRCKARPTIMSSASAPRRRSTASVFTPSPAIAKSSASTPMDSTTATMAPSSTKPNISPRRWLLLQIGHDELDPYVDPRPPV